MRYFNETAEMKLHPAVNRRSAMMLRLPLLGLLFLSCLLLPALVNGQTIAPTLASVNDQTQAPVEGAGHDYQHLLNETVNFSNGSVSFDINFPIPKGRGLTLPYALSYNSGTVNTLNSLDGVTPKWNDNSMFDNTQGWDYKGIPRATVQVFSLTPPTGPPGATLIPCNYQAGMTFTDPSGVQHNLNTAAFASAYNAQGDISTCGLSQVVLPPGGDGQVAATIWPGTPSTYMTGTDWHSGPFIVEDKNGTIYSFNSQFASSPSSPNLKEVPDSIEDRNGNVIYLSPNIGSGTAWTDSLGRSGPTWSGSTLTIGNQTYTANWGTTTSNFNVAVQEPVSGYGILCQGVPTNVTGTHPALQSLTLPNGKEFQFIYGSYGLLSEIIYPDGGWVKYTWQLGPGYNEEASMGGMRQNFDQNGQVYYTPVSYGCNSAYQTPVLATRTVSFDGTHVAQTQNFAFSTTWAYNSDGSLNGWTQKTATVTTTDNVRNLTSKVVYTYSPMGVPSQPFAASGIATMIPVEKSVAYYDWGKSSPSKLVQKTWLDQFNLSSETTTIYGTTTLTSKSTYSYTTGMCANPALSSYVYLTEKDDTDFGSGGSPGAIVEKTIYNYHCFASAHVYQTYDSGPWNNYSGVTLVPAVSSITVEDGSGTIHAATQFAYDGTAPSSVGDPVQYDHDYDGVTIRGNLTSVTKCTTLPSSPTSTCAGPTTNYAYDNTGQIASVTDPAGNRTSYSFADRYTDTSSAPDTNAYLTEIDYPNGLKKDFGHSYSLGYLTESTDFNPGNWTTYSYGTQVPGCSFADTLDRITEVDYPDGGKTTNCYNDDADSVTTSKLLDSTTNTWETSVSYRDGLFHTVATQLTSDPGGTTTVDMSYDGEGMLASRSNPHRGSGSSTDGTTHFYYDALGHPIETQEQDGSVVETCYDGVASYLSVYCSSSQIGQSGVLGTRVDSTGESGSHWQRVTDALGRLVQVIEPNGTSQTPTMETDYSYDILGNLLSINQWGGAYNCCSTTERVRTFTYDNVGRLLTAQNSETGTVTYSYLNGSSYCAGDQSLPCKKTDARGISISYAYDSVNRLVSKTYSDSEPAVSYTYDAHQSGGYGTGNYGEGLRTGMTDASGSTTWTYDTMGRPWVEMRTIGTIQKQAGTEYNEGGSARYVHYPSGAKLHYLVGGAGKDLSLHDDINNIQYALCATYAPPGELGTVTMGSSTCSTGGIQDSLTYDTRLQPGSQSSVSGSTTYLNLTYDFHLGNGDNGDLYAITNVKDPTRSQAFTYDTLNRILTAKTPNPSSHSWGIGFTIDAFGNLTQTSPISGMTNFPMSVNQQVNTKNQFTLLGYSYDAAGEVLNDGLSTGCSGNGYSWNAEGLQSCANGTTYTYDGDEQRVKKSNGTLYWGGGAGAALAESDLSGNLTEEYIFFNGQRIAMRNASTHVVSYFVLDHLGSTSVLADAAGNILNDSDYTPYGGEIPFTTGNPGQHYKFTGKERDSETGNDYFGARYFENTMGRWLSPDWSAKIEPVPYSKLDDPQSLNLYAYVGNNPMMRVDPDGHDGCPHGSGSPSAGCQADQNSCKTNPQQCKAVLDAVSSGHSVEEGRANYRAQQQNKPHPAQSVLSKNTGYINELAVWGGILLSKAIQHNNPNPAKGARPVKDKSGKITGWTIPGKGADKGKQIPKSLDWGKANGLDPTSSKWAMGGAAGVTATGITLSDVLEVGGLALAF